MAGAFLEITVDDRELSAALQKLQAKLGDLTPVFRDLGEHLLNSTRARFDSQTGPDGRSWPALSPDYVKHKPKNKDKILTLDGFLRGQMTIQVSPHELRIGTPPQVPYGATHQFGAKKGAFGVNKRGNPIPWGDIPARPFLGLSDQDRADVMDILSEWLSA